MVYSVEDKIKLITAEAIKLQGEGDPLDDELFLEQEMEYTLNLAKVLTTQMSVAYSYVKNVATGMRISFDRNALYDAAERAYMDALGTVAPQKMQKIIDKTVKEIYETSRKAVTEVSMTLPDKKAIEFMRSVDKFYVGKQFAGYEDQIREIIRVSTFEKGLGAVDTAKLIRDAVKDGVEREFYRYSVVARTSANRVRNWSRVYAFHAEQVTEVEFVAMMDERTSAICQNMNGAVFEVSKLIEHIERVEEAGEDRLPEVSPFPKLENIIDKEGRRVSENDLAASGFAIPPLHCNCRSILVYHDPEIRSLTQKQIDESVNYIDNELERKLNENIADRDLSKDYYEYENKKDTALSDAERLAINKYTSSDYIPMNELLRDGKVEHYQFFKSTDEIKSAINSCSSALEKLPSVTEGIVSRSIYAINNDYDTLKSIYSKDFVSRSFFSTTTIPYTADYATTLGNGEKTNGILMHIIPKTGKYIREFSAYAREREVLFNPNSAFMVLKTKEEEISYGTKSYKCLVVYAKEI